MTKFKYLYESDEDNIFEDFFRLAFKEYDAIRISSCYVSTKILIELIDELEKIEKNRGYFHLIFDLHGNLNTSKTLKLLSEVELADIIFEEIFSDFKRNELEQYKRLAQLIQNDTIMMKVIDKGDGSLYHKKQYIFSTIDLGDMITASGSCNFTISGTHSINSENLTTENIYERCLQVQSAFLKDWNTNELGTNIKDIKSILSEKMEHKIKEVEKLPPITIDPSNILQAIIDINNLATIEDKKIYHLFINYSEVENLISLDTTNVYKYSNGTSINICDIHIADNSIFYDYPISLYEENKGIYNCLYGNNDIEYTQFATSSFEIRRKDIDLFDHQKEAIDNIYANNHNGILAMATGSGKTITAIEYMMRTYKDQKYFFIVVPLRALAEQWCEEINKFTNFDIVKVWGGL